MTASKSGQPARFVGAAIEVHHDRGPSLEKKPGVPDSFIWDGRTYRVVELLREWHDYRKRGKTAAFYVKEQGSFRAKKAEGRGSWGVGRDYYRVRTDAGEVFDIYYDRSPASGGRKGGWFLLRQLLENGVGR
jgi:hypothetical protein